MAHSVRFIRDKLITAQRGAMSAWIRMPIGGWNNIDWQEVAAGLPMEEIHVDGQLYLRRYFLDPMAHNAQTKLGERLLLHSFFLGDEDRRLHNHPWDWAKSLILSGGYSEQRPIALSPNGLETTIKHYKAGDMMELSGFDFHRVLEVLPNTWTLFRHGPRMRDWGFLEQRDAYYGATYYVDPYVSGQKKHERVGNGS